MKEHFNFNHVNNSNLKTSYTYYFFVTFVTDYHPNYLY